MARLGLISTWLCWLSSPSTIDNFPRVFYTPCMQWSADRVIALVLIILCAILIALGIDTELKSILAMAAVYFFGTAYMERKK